MEDIQIFSCASTHPHFCMFELEHPRHSIQLEVCTHFKLCFNQPTSSTNLLRGYIKLLLSNRQQPLFCSTCQYRYHMMWYSIVLLQCGGLIPWNTESTKHPSLVNIPNLSWRKRTYTILWLRPFKEIIFLEPVGIRLVLWVMWVWGVSPWVELTLTFLTHGSKWNVATYLWVRVSYGNPVTVGRLAIATSSPRMPSKRIQSGE